MVIGAHGLFTVVTDGMSATTDVLWRAGEICEVLRGGGRGGGQRRRRRAEYHGSALPTQGGVVVVVAVPGGLGGVYSNGIHAATAISFLSCNL